MPLVVFQKAYVIQSSNGTFWPKEREGEYTCPNAIGSTPALPFCGFVAQPNVHKFCHSDPQCIGYALDLQNHLYQPTRLGFNRADPNRQSATYVKTLTISNDTNLWISERPDEYTCPFASNVSKNGGFSQYCMFSSESAAVAYCGQDSQCLGFICLKGVCILTRKEFESTEKSVIEDNFNGILQPNTTPLTPPNTKDSPNNLGLIIGIVVVCIVIVVLLVWVVFYRAASIKKFEDATMPPSSKSRMSSISSVSYRTESTQKSAGPSLLSAYSHMNYYYSKKPCQESSHTIYRMESSKRFMAVDPLEWEIADVCNWLQVSIGASYTAIVNADNLNLTGKKLKKLIDHPEFTKDLRLLCDEHFSEAFMRAKITQLFESAK